MKLLYDHLAKYKHVKPEAIANELLCTPIVSTTLTAGVLDSLLCPEVNYRPID